MNEPEREAPEESPEDERARLARATPWDRDAEESLIGSMLISADGRRRALRGCDAADLWLPEHRAIYRAIEALHNSGQSVDVVTVQARLAEDGEDIPRARLAAIQAATPLSAAASSYADIVARFARLRAGMHLGHNLIAAGHARDFEAFEALADTASLQLAPTTVHVQTYDLTDLWNLAQQERDDPTKPWVIPACLRTNELIAYTGSEGIGKSTYLRQIGGCVASGVHPFTGLSVGGLEPQRVLQVDLQEDLTDVAEALEMLRRALVDRYEPGWYRTVSLPGGLDLLGSKGQRMMEGLLADHRPSLVLMGPVNSMFRAPEGRSRYGEDVIEELRAVMVDYMARYEFALILEGHAGNDRSHDEDWRIRGSSVWRSWPAFSHGMKEVGKAPREVEVIRARRDRYADRCWPTRLFQNPAGRFPWSVGQGDYAAILRAMGLHYLLGEGEQPGLADPNGEEVF